jgi:hypothetical protein
MPRRQYQIGPSRYAAREEQGRWYVYEDWWEATRNDDEEDCHRLVAGPISEVEAKALAFRMDEGNKGIERAEHAARMKKLFG